MRRERGSRWADDDNRGATPRIIRESTVSEQLIVWILWIWHISLVSSKLVIFLIFTVQIHWNQ